MSGYSSEEVAMERRTICFPHHGTRGVLQHGDQGFQDEIDRLYVPAENNAMEQLIELKRSLRTLSTEDFWGAVTEGLSRILGAEICFVMKRVLVDDQNSAVEMPPIGEPGSCIMAAALHYCANDGSKTTVNSTKFHAYGCPCAYMRHDKVFVIPDRLGEFITNNPNRLPTPCEAYMAVPLFEEGRCFAHFGAMWSVEGAAQRKLSWAFMELIMHSLEDMIAQRFVEGTDFIQQSTKPVQEKPKVIPHDAVTIAQSLRPYAGSLSHELRTPMQGIVGMLDVMYATVQEAVETQDDSRIRRVFETLKENIEIVQDSSRRAVEAADNVVHAYDMDMSMPEVPQALLDEPADSPFSATTDRRPEILVAGNNLPINRPNKRRRGDDAGSRSGSDVGAYKFPRLGRAPSSCQRCSEQEAQQGVREAERIQTQPQVGAGVTDAPTAEDFTLAANAMTDAGRIIAPGLRHASFRELIQNVMSESLKVGGRPDYATAQETDLGEVLEVRTRGSDGTVGQKLIEWSVDPAVPTTMFIDEKDLCKLISCVLLNALKFTDRYDGRIRVHVSMSHRGRYISIKISDNGPGIPAAFLPKLFQPFSQENGSITRPSEGLGLGLMVGRGIARKLGGDLKCLRAETTGANHGTEFEIKVPVHAGETISRPSSPYGSPMPRKATIVTTNLPQVRLPPAEQTSPRTMSQALQDVVNENPFAARLPLPPVAIPSTPPSPKSQSMSGPETDVEATSSPPASSLPSPPIETAKGRPRIRKSVSNPEIDRDLAKKYPLTFLVAEDNKINRKLLVSMLSKFGYKSVHEAHDGAEAVRQMEVSRAHHEQIDVVLMDLWMPLMDGYEAAKRILGNKNGNTTATRKPTVLAVTADVTDGALERAAEVGMRGFMTKPYKMLDLQRLITEYCASHKARGVTSAV